MILQSRTYQNRWLALVFLALGLAIVIIDNTVLNVAIPYILRDLNTSLSAIQWVVSGYALIIATVLITVGRLGDLYGRRRIFLVGAGLFAIGSFIASISKTAPILFLGEAFIEAIGAAMMLTSSLSLLASEFQGKERSIAFGVWGSVAGAAAALGPLLGGYFTTYYSWRWSLRINVFVAIIAIIGAILTVRESKDEDCKSFDWWGTFFSGIGLFSLIFALIEGRKYGWFAPAESFVIDNWEWPLDTISVIPFAFLLAAIFLGTFVLTEYTIEKSGGSPLLRLSLFKNSTFSLGSVTLLIIALGQFGIFFALPIFLQNVLGLTAFQTGVVFLASSSSIFIFGPTAGFLATRVQSKWVVTAGMFILAYGIFLLIESLSPTATGWTLAPALVVFGVGAGMTSSQLTNIILSAVSVNAAGEASAVNATIRQVGTSVGIAIIGGVFASSIATLVSSNIRNDANIPGAVKDKIMAGVSDTSIESGRAERGTLVGIPENIANSITDDVNRGITDAAKRSMGYALVFTLAGALFSLLIPSSRELAPVPPEKKIVKKKNVPEDRVWSIP